MGIRCPILPGLTIVVRKQYSTIVYSAFERDPATAPRLTIDVRGLLGDAAGPLDGSPCYSIGRFHEPELRTISRHADILVAIQEVERD
jgi:hypothetical protein